MGLKDRTPTTVAEYEEYRTRLSNWGRWGADDQLGTLNHITPDTRTAAAGLVRDGRTVSCANPLATPAVVPDERRNRNPAEHRMTVNPGSSGDYIGVSYHGFVNTHIDALCHIFTGEGGRLYNDADSALVTSEGGAQPLRRQLARRHRDPRRAVRHPAHARASACAGRRAGGGLGPRGLGEADGHHPPPGDAVLIRSGCEPVLERNPDFAMEFPPNTPGVGVSCLEYLYDTTLRCSAGTCRRRAARASTASASRSTRSPSRTWACRFSTTRTFEALSEACAEAGRYEFMLVIAPLVVLGGTGSPVNPLAVF
jgi:hypothetical protein